MTVLLAIAAVIVTVAAFFVYMTLAINAGANREDLVDAAPPIVDDTSVFMRALHGAVGEAPTRGNHVDVLQNGDQIFPAMIEAIRGARETVHFSTYVWWKGASVPD